MVSAEPELSIPAALESAEEDSEGELQGGSGNLKRGQGGKRDRRWVLQANVFCPFWRNDLFLGTLHGFRPMIHKIADITNVNLAAIAQEKFVEHLVEINERTAADWQLSEWTG